MSSATCEGDPLVESFFRVVETLPLFEHLSLEFSKVFDVFGRFRRGKHESSKHNYIYMTPKYWRPPISRIATISTSVITQDGTSFRILKAQSIRTNEPPDYYIPQSGFWLRNTREPSTT
jgi:hypothetical protein